MKYAQNVLETSKTNLISDALQLPYIDFSHNLILLYNRMSHELRSASVFAQSLVYNLQISLYRVLQQNSEELKISGCQNL